VQEGTPPLSAGERHALSDSIAEFGVRESVKVLPDGRIVDGHHRWELSDGRAPLAVLDLPDPSARLLGRALNAARRHMSPEQAGEFRDVFRRDRLAAKAWAFALRGEGWTQQRVAMELGVSQSTIAEWETDASGSTIDIDSASLTPDLRVKIPWSERAVIYERHRAGERQADIAADYKVSRVRVGQVVAKVAAERTAERDRSADVEGITETPTNGFRVILADPPWQYAQKSERLNGTTDPHYPTMSADAIAALPVAGVAADDAILLLWTTWPFLPVAMRVIDSWGFRYITGLPWVKVEQVDTQFDGTTILNPRTGVGFWFRGASEPLLLAKRGTPARTGVPWDGLLSDRNVHSRKPDSHYELAESLGSPRLELFARRRRDEWTSAGHVVDNGQDIKERLRGLAR